LVVICINGATSGSVARSAERPPGSGYERIATAECSDRTTRYWLKQWAKDGVAQRVHAIAQAAYDLINGLELEDLSVDWGITKG
jgi:predicted metal-dependent hydrolase